MNNDENIIFFDTETTGVIPKGKEEPLVYFNDFPHVVQLSWKLGDKEGDYIIKRERERENGVSEILRLIVQGSCINTAKRI